MLTEEYKSHNPDQLVTELQAHVKKVTAPYKYPRKVTVPSHPATV